MKIADYNEKHMGLLEKALLFIPKLAMILLKFIMFIALSILVVPSMFVMLYLHKPWEKMIDDVHSLNPF